MTKPGNSSIRRSKVGEQRTKRQTLVMNERAKGGQVRTLVERTTRFTMLLHRPRMEEHGKTKSIQNGPVLAGHGAEAVRDTVADTIMDMLAHLH